MDGENRRTHIESCKPCAPAKKRKGYALAAPDSTKGQAKLLPVGLLHMACAGALTSSQQAAPAASGTSASACTNPRATSDGGDAWGIITDIELT